MAVVALLRKARSIAVRNGRGLPLSCASSGEKITKQRTTGITRTCGFIWHPQDKMKAERRDSNGKPAPTHPWRAGIVKLRLREPGILRRRFCDHLVFPSVFPAGSERGKWDHLPRYHRRPH